MPSDEKKSPLEDLKEKFRRLFTPGSQQKKKDALPPKMHFSIWYFLIAFFLFTYLQQNFFSTKVETIPYSEFKQNLVAGNVTKLIVGPENINGTLKGVDKKREQDFTTIRVDDPNLVKELDEHKVRYSGHYESKLLGTILSWILPLGIMFLIWRFAMKKMGPGAGVMSFGKSKAKLFAQNETMVTFADVAGIDEAKEETPGGSGVFEESGQIPETGGEDPQRGAAGRSAGDR